MRNNACIHAGRRAAHHVSTGLLSVALALPLALSGRAQSASPQAVVATLAVVDAAPALLLAFDATVDTDPQPYWVSEKLDGVRAYWDGRQLWFRSGRLVPAPAWFTERLPSEPLDGELWLGRGRFEEVAGIVRKNTAQYGLWQQIRYMVFEAPAATGDFSQRLTHLNHLHSLATPLSAEVWSVVEQFRLPHRAALQRRLREVERAGGEGLMLHRADAPYVSGRNSALLKVKTRQDAEATVIAHLPGRGRLQGVMGALLVRNAEGMEFRLGSGFSDSDRRHPPAIGTPITYQFQGKTHNGTPRFARYLRARLD